MCPVVSNMYAFIIKEILRIDFYIYNFEKSFTQCCGRKKNVFLSLPRKSQVTLLGLNDLLLNGHEKPMIVSCILGPCGLFLTERD